RGEHAGRGLAAGLTDHHRDRSLEHHVEAAPDLATGGVGVDVLLEAVPLGEQLAGGRRAEGHDTGIARRSTGFGAMSVALVAHPSSSSDPKVTAGTLPRDDISGVDI